MASPQFTPEDFATALQNLLPRGLVWPRDADAVQSKVALGLAKAMWRSADRAIDLLIDAFPPTAIELLPEWELSLGLPDTCGAGVTTLEGRQAQVLAKLIGAGGQSVEYMTNLAAALGYAITITQFARHDVRADVNAPLYDIGWAYAWQVHAPIGATVLECLFERAKPAHTKVFFTYT